jgi:hypothetical protein
MFFILLPALAGFILLLRHGLLLLLLGERGRQYQAWENGLTPEQRTAVELAELAALSDAAWALHEHHRRMDERLTSSVMGRTLPDGRGPRPTQQIASYRQQAPLASGLGAQDPTGASRAVIARHHPGHLDPAIGTYKSMPW